MPEEIALSLAAGITCGADWSTLISDDVSTLLLDTNRVKSGNSSLSPSILVREKRSQILLGSRSHKVAQS